MPGMTAGSFVAPSPLNMATPPQTPRSAASSVSGAPFPASGVKRDVSVVSEDETAREGERGEMDGEGEDAVEGGQPRKRRRIAPTFVGHLSK